jgi:hypothetical protein
VYANARGTEVYLRSVNPINPKSHAGIQDLRLGCTQAFKAGMGKNADQFFGFLGVLAFLLVFFARPSEY